MRSWFLQRNIFCWPPILLVFQASWATVIFQLSSPTFLLANPRNGPRVKASISRLRQLKRNPEDTKAVCVCHLSLKMRIAIENQKARERKSIHLIHHILILRWKLVKASINLSISIGRNTSQSHHLIQKLRLTKVWRGIWRENTRRKKGNQKLHGIPCPRTKEIQKARGIQGVQGRWASTASQVPPRVRGSHRGRKRDSITATQVLLGTSDTQGDQRKRDTIVTQVLVTPIGTQGDPWRGSVILV